MVKNEVNQGVRRVWRQIGQHTWILLMLAIGITGLLAIRVVQHAPIDDVMLLIIMGGVGAEIAREKEHRSWFSWAFILFMLVMAGAEIWLILSAA